MGSSAQNSSGVHWCRRRVRFNEVPEKVPEVRGFAQSQVRFNRLPEKVPEWEALCSRVSNRSGSTGSGSGFRRRFLVKVGEALVQQSPEKVPGEGFQVLEKFREALVQSQGSTRFQGLGVPGEGCREGPGEGSTGSGEESWVQGQVRFNRSAPKPPRPSPEASPEPSPEPC